MQKFNGKGKKWRSKQWFGFTDNSNGSSQKGMVIKTHNYYVKHLWYHLNDGFYLKLVDIILSFKLQWSYFKLYYVSNRCLNIYHILPNWSWWCIHTRENNNSVVAHETRSLTSQSQTLDRINCRVYTHGVDYIVFIWKCIHSKKMNRWDSTPHNYFYSFVVVETTNISVDQKKPYSIRII